MSFLFNETATTEIYTLSLHDALPILWALRCWAGEHRLSPYSSAMKGIPSMPAISFSNRSEEHTSELQSPVHLVCRLLLEKKNFSIKHSFILQDGRGDHLPGEHSACS